MYYRYAQFGAQFHFWLHGLFGGTLGLMRDRMAAGATAARRRGGAVGGRAIGHLSSAVPDVLFLVFGVLRMLWMGAFALHITLHVVPRPLETH